MSLPSPTLDFDPRCYAAVRVDRHCALRGRCAHYIRRRPSTEVISRRCNRKLAPSWSHACCAQLMSNMMSHLSLTTLTLAVRPRHSAASSEGGGKLCRCRALHSTSTHAATLLSGSIGTARCEAAARTTSAGARRRRLSPGVAIGS